MMKKLMGNYPIVVSIYQLMAIFQQGFRMYRSRGILHRSRNVFPDRNLCIFSPLVIHTKYFLKKRNHLWGSSKNIKGIFFIFWLYIIAYFKTLKSTIYHFLKIASSYHCEINCVRSFHLPMVSFGTIFMYFRIH